MAVDAAGLPQAQNLARRLKLTRQKHEAQGNFRMVLIRIARKLIKPASLGDMPEDTQYGAIPFRIIDGQVVFLMITSRRSANWVFPKGSVSKGRTPHETAAEETFEEAGVVGEMGPDPIGAYVHARNNEQQSPVRVALFGLNVTEQLDTWPEESQRFRHWALLPQLRSLMASRQAARIAAELNRRIIEGTYTPGKSRITE